MIQEIRIVTVPAGQQRDIYEWCLGRQTFTAWHASKALGIPHQSAIRACGKLVDLGLLTPRGHLLSDRQYPSKLFQAVIPERRAVVDPTVPLNWPMRDSVAVS